MNPMLLVIFIFGLIFLGTIIAANGSIPRPSRKSRKERSELKRLEECLDKIQIEAAQHSMLGNDLSVIILSIINDYKKEIS